MSCRMRLSERKIFGIAESEQQIVCRHAAFARHLNLLYNYPAVGTCNRQYGVTVRVDAAYCTGVLHRLEVCGENFGRADLCAIFIQSRPCCGIWRQTANEIDNITSGFAPIDDAIIFENFGRRVQIAVGLRLSNGMV